MIKCFNCGTVHNYSFCPNCGAPARPIPQTQKRGMPALVIIALSLFGAFCLFILGTFVLKLILDVGATSKSNSETSIQKIEVIKTDFQKATSTTPDQESDILQILNDCGVENIESIVWDEGLDELNEKGETGYRISANGINNIILYLKENKSVNIIRYADNELYTNGAVVSTLSDYTFTWDEQSDLQISCQEAIKTILKSPSTAKFPKITKWAFGKKDGEIIIQSYVDSQNSFGAELRSEFQFILSADDLTVKSLIFDGEEMISE